MKFSVGITGQGISFRIGNCDPELLTPSPSADQQVPKRSYVYAHRDQFGVPFYIGKGTGRRAWDDARHPLWVRYVRNHLQDQYTVHILSDGMTPEQAEELENAWIAQESTTLVNWINFGRQTNFEILEKFHSLRRQNLMLAAAAKQKEKSGPDQAASLYMEALKGVDSYARLKTELGLVGQLIDEERAESGFNGELFVLDRLTLCLVKLGRGEQAQKIASEYFFKYRADERLSAAEAIKKRVAKAVRREA